MICIAGYITTNGVHVACKQSKELEQRSMTNSVRVTLFLLANVNRLAIVTLMMVRVDQPVYIMTSDAAYDDT